MDTTENYRQLPHIRHGSAGSGLCVFHVLYISQTTLQFWQNIFRVFSKQNAVLCPYLALVFCVRTLHVPILPTMIFSQRKVKGTSIEFNEDCKTQQNLYLFWKKKLLAHISSGGEYSEKTNSSSRSTNIRTIFNKFFSVLENVCYFYFLISEQLLCLWLEPLSSSFQVRDPQRSPPTHTHYAPTLPLIPHPSPEIVTLYTDQTPYPRLCTVPYQETELKG